MKRCRHREAGSDAAGVPAKRPAVAVATSSLPAKRPAVPGPATAVAAAADASVAQPWTVEEDTHLLSAVKEFGQQWSLIHSIYHAVLRGRTTVDLRNRAMVLGAV